MSTQAIGSALGVSNSTVAGDLSTVRDRTDDLPATVTSLDGRTRPATQPPRPRTDLDEEREAARVRRTKDGLALCQ